MWRGHFYCVCAARVDITAYVQPGGENRITVAVTENHAGLSTGMRFAGRNWSGIYSRACVEIGAAVYMEDVYISNLEQDRAVIRGMLVNDGLPAIRGKGFSGNWRQAGGKGRRCPGLFQSGTGVGDRCEGAGTMGPPASPAS